MITEDNIGPELTHTVFELMMIKARLESYLGGPPKTITEIDKIEEAFSEAVTPIPEMILFVADNPPDPLVVGSKLRECINLPTEILDLLIQVRRRSKL